MAIDHDELERMLEHTPHTLVVRRERTAVTPGSTDRRRSHVRRSPSPDTSTNDSRRLGWYERLLLKKGEQTNGSKRGGGGHAKGGHNYGR